MYSYQPQFDDIGEKFNFPHVWWSCSWRKNYYNHLVLPPFLFFSYALCVDLVNRLKYNRQKHTLCTYVSLYFMDVFCQFIQFSHALIKVHSHFYMHWQLFIHNFMCTDKSTLTIYNYVTICIYYNLHVIFFAIGKTMYNHLKSKKKWW